MSRLAARGVVKRFGGLTAVDHMRLDVDAGEVVSLIGPNGAGKTTLFNCLTGLLTPDQGEIELGGQDLTGLGVHKRAAQGLGRTFQRLEVFAGMSVFDNVQVAVEAARGGSMLGDLFRLRTRDDLEIRRATEELVSRTELGDVADMPAGDLSTGTLRLVELARALATDPKVLLLDEPASGLDHHETEMFKGLLRGIAADGVGILLVEHDVDLVMEVSDRVFVMDFGRFVAEGPPEQVREDPAVIAAYLGVENAADLAVSGEAG